VAELLLNGRPPLAWELPAVARAYACARERDLRQLAGVLATAGPPRTLACLREVLAAGSAAICLGVPSVQRLLLRLAGESR
jgi:hypothetical protein